MTDEDLGVVNLLNNMKVGKASEPGVTEEPQAQRRGWSSKEAEELPPTDIKSEC